MPKPKKEAFDLEALWIDSVVMAVFAKVFTSQYLRGQEDEAFVCALLSDLALPVLLTAWGEYYAPVIAAWRSGNETLSDIERKHFRWDHAQAGAWIVKSWNFSDEMVCFIGSHNLTREQLEESGLLDTIALPIAAASRAPSILRSGPEHRDAFVAAAVQWLNLSPSDFHDCAQEVKGCLAEVFMLFDLPDRGAVADLDSLIDTVSVKEEES